MDINKLAEALKATLQPDQREDAEKHLDEVKKIINFVPSLLQLVMSEQLELPVRQAGAVYLKNMVSQHWEEPDQDTPNDPSQFTLHENDKKAVRDNLVEAVISAPPPIRVQLACCVTQLVKHDYPGKWPGIAEKVLGFLQSERHDTWLGSLICLQQLVKNYEYKNRKEERANLNEAMTHILPVIHHICVTLLPDNSEPSVTIQKQILKVFFALIQFYLPLELITKEIFTSWMELARQVVDRPIPEECNQIDEDERPELIWWKCKKWAMHIITRCFERYGSPGNTIKEYNEFSEWYLKTFSAGILQVLLKLLDQYRNKVYVTPRVLQQTLNYFTQAVNHAHSWKIVKPHMQVIIQDVIFPLMCHSDEDEELWQSDPIEYIRAKYDVYEEFFNPATAAQTLLHSAVAKRKEFLQKTMGFVMSVLTAQNVEAKQKSGALHMVGALADVILVKKIYKDQAELMLATHVLPEVMSPLGFMRARACWVIHCFSEVKYRNPENLKSAVELLRVAMSSDKELPVRVEAAIGLQLMLTQQDNAKALIQPHIQQVISDLLNLIRETENDDLTTVLQKIICLYQDEIAPLAVEITTHLAHTFACVIESDPEQSDDKAIAAMGLLNTLETICTVMEEQKELLQHIEGVVIEVIGLILKKNIVEFFEEMLSLVFSLTSPQISTRMWSILPMLYDLFQKDNMDYFTDMMPALHNYITVDPQAFLSDQKYMGMIFDMCKAVLHSTDAGEDAECHAAKLLEVILIQFKGSIDQVVPLFLELVLERLTREIRTTELRTMCIQVLIAALYYNTNLLLEYLEKSHLPGSPGVPLTAHVLKLWISDTDCFLGLHDRKLSVLGLCVLMSLQATSRPAAVNEISKDIVPSLCVLFKGLKRAYESRSKDDESSGDEEDGDEDGADGVEELEDEDDVIDNDGEQYLVKLDNSNFDGGDDEDDTSEFEDDDSEETALESYDTVLDKDDCPIDEYQIFKSVLEGIRESDKEWYDTLVGHLDDDQKKEINEVYRLADQRAAALESKKIEMAGGYSFTQVQVPTSFSFGSGS